MSVIGSPRTIRRGSVSRAVRRRLPSVAALGIAIMLSLVVAGIASAHAKYKSSDPAANAVLKAAPSVVTVHFYENVNPDGSSLTVYDSRGKVVSAGTGQVSTADTKTMTVSMQGNGSEAYLVVWKTVSLDDGDPDIGGFNFFVGNAAAPATTGSSASQGSSSGVPGWVAALIGVAGVVVGSGAMFLARRSR
ncbi:MAG: copper resistance protein CopC [Ktedonobacterales bacterium]